MANSLEVRSPFLDVDLVEFVLGLPWRLRFSKEELKPLLRRACGELWPKELAGRDKQGFGGPLTNWVRRPEVVHLIRRVCEPGSPLVHLLPGAPKVLLADVPEIGWEDAQFRWTLLSLGLWLEQHAECLRNT